MSNKLRDKYVFDSISGYSWYNLNADNFAKLILLIIIAYPVSYFYRTIKKENSFFGFFICSICFWLTLNLISFLSDRPIKRIIIDTILKQIIVHYYHHIKIKTLIIPIDKIMYKRKMEYSPAGNKKVEIEIYQDNKKIYSISSDYIDELDIDRIEKILNELGVQKLTT